MKSNLKKLISLAPIAAIALMARSGHATTIAIVDSGSDILHKEIANKIWDNPGEVDDGVDNDDNGYVDDLHGWNFLDNNNHLVNRKLIGTFEKDVYKFFEVQTRLLNGTGTAEDKAWYLSIKNDQKFIARLEDFGNFVHGTHVAGIAAKDANQARLMPLKMIGNPTPIGGGIYRGATFSDSSINTFNTYVRSNMVAGGGDVAKEKIIKLGLDLLAKAQGQGLAAPAAYLHLEHAKVANCSFGTSREAIKPLIKPLIEKILGKTLTDDEINAYANYFMSKVVDSMEASFIAVAPETLFVMAAGNDGSNNDQVPTAPANVKTENTITVAATLSRTKLASFSNYGEAMVDIAAPGVGILSSTPGNEYVQLSGTSQATPYVTNIAGRLFDTNPKFTISDVKRVMMETVDKKDFLVHKVKSEGIANASRALYAARLSLTMPLADAIKKANREVRPMEVDFQGESMDDSNLYVLPLPKVLF